MRSPSDGILEKLIADDLMTSGIGRASFESLERYVTTCENLGSILAIHDVWQPPSSDLLVGSPESVPFHCDGPVPDVVAWFCVRQDEEAGESLLADTLPILRGLEPEQRAHLRSVTIPYFDDAHPGGPAGTCALLRGDDEADWRINYTPWHLPEMDEGQKAAVAAFDQALSTVPPTSCRLAAGEAIFVDNWRILHARGPLRADSRRHLKRVWLRTPRASRLDRIAARPDRRAAL
ncbi:MAG TPA: TauD/TfdA family dioxygenase [Allosphingosinicella sp.]